MAKIGSEATKRRGIILLVMLLGAALVLTVLGLVDPRVQIHPWHSLFGPREHGNWAAVSIDGRKVSPRDYRVAVFNSKVVGGRDGCNDWSYASAADASGERMVESTMALFPENEKGRVLRVLAYASKVELLPDGELRLTARGHRAIFARCRWKNVKESGPGSTSKSTQCLIR